MKDYNSSYLHRMFINNNPILSQGNEISIGVETIQERFRNKAYELKELEDNWLRALATALTGDPKSTPNDGMVIFESLRESGEQVNGLISEAMVKTYLKTKKKTQEEVQKEIVRAINKNINNAPTEAGVVLNKKTAEYRDSINLIAKQAATATVSNKRYVDMVPATQGTKMENIMTNLILTKWSKEYRQNKIGKNLKKITVTGIGKESGGAQYVKVQSVPDINITIGKEDFKFSQKVKVSNRKIIEVLKGKPLSNLLQEGEQSAYSEFVKFGLINQHYWGDPDYQKKVLDAWNGNIPAEINPMGTSSTGIEQMSYVSTIQAFHPIIDIMYNSFALNLFLGFKRNDPNLFTAVIGNPNPIYQKGTANPIITKPLKGTIIRSSDVIMELADSLMTNKGGLKFKTSFKSDADIIENAWSDEYISHDKWESYIKGKFDDILQKTKIETTYNYGVK